MGQKAIAVVGVLGVAACSGALVLGCGSDDDSAAPTTDAAGADGSAIGSNDGSAVGTDAGSGDATVGTTNDGSASGDGAAATSGVVLGGTVTGLLGKGLVLSDGSTDAQTLTVDKDGTFAFANAIPFGQMYNVTVSAQPTVPSQSCVIATGTGSGIASASSTPSVTVTCTTGSYAVGGTVSGLIGPIDAGVASDAGDAGDGGDGGDGGDAGSVDAGGATSTSDAGGVPDDAVIVQNGAEQVVVAGNGPFAFTTKIASDGTYDVRIARQPLYPAQTCRIAGAAGTVVAGDVTTVVVNCTTNQYTVGGTVTGLTGTLVLQDGAGNSATITSNGAYSFAPTPSSQLYNVAVTTQPVGQLCSVANPEGTLGEQDVTNVGITCVPTYLIGGTLTGLTAGTLVLEDNGGDDLALTSASNGSFYFATGVVGPYKVTVKTQPATENCSVANPKGTATGTVHNITVTCL